MASQQSNEIDELIKGLRHCPGFKSYLILNNDGIVIKWDQEGNPMPYSKAVQYAHHVMDVCNKSKMYVRDIFDPQESHVESIRVRSDDYELIVSQEGNYTLVVIQDSKRKSSTDEPIDNPV